jgi:tetratricopeptide (TPR) repeat protein
MYSSLQKLKRKASTLIPVAIIIIVAFAVYFNSLSNFFVYDDSSQILQNELIRNISNIPKIFTSSVLRYQKIDVVSNYYRPLMHIIYMVNYLIFGLEPRGFHLVNVLFHAGSCVLIFVLTSRLLKECPPAASWPLRSVKGWMTNLTMPPFIAAVLYAVHPIHTEAVTWVASIPDLSFTFFYLLSLFLYIVASDKDSSFPGVRIFFSSASYLLSCLCKEPALTLPIVLFVYDLAFSPKGKWGKAHWKRYVPYILISAGYFFLRYSALQGVAPLTRHQELSNYQYFINVFPLFTHYLSKLVLPTNLNAFYVLHPIGSILETTGIVSLIVSLGFMIVLFIALKKQKVIFFSLSLIVVPLLPVFYIPALGENTFTERYLYLPSAGFVILIAWVFSLLGTRSLVTVVKTLVLVMLISIYSFGTVSRNFVWKDDETLFSDMIDKSPDASLPHVFLGEVFFGRGDTDSSSKQYQLAVMIDPNSTYGHMGLGKVYDEKGMRYEAIAQYELVLSALPGNYEAHYYVGIAYEEINAVDEAIAHFETAVRLSRNFSDAHDALGVCYAKKGLLDKAIEQFSEALRISPESYLFESHLNKAYAQKGPTK